MSVQNNRHVSIAVFLCAAAVLLGGLTSTAFGWWPCCPKKKVVKEVVAEPCKPAAQSECAESELCLPSNPQPGECYSRVYVPATFRTFTERHLVKEASERIEIVPAEMKWVEERICSKEACTQLEVVPAEYRWEEKTIEIQPAYTGWVMQSGTGCTPSDKLDPSCVFCVRSTPPKHKTLKVQCLAKPACVRQVTTPAEYQTIRRQVVACPATTKKVCIPAEYEDVTKTVMVCPARIKWEQVVCEEKLTTDAVNKIKTALVASGYIPGPLNGKLAKEDWDAITQYQHQNGLGVGQLSHDTLKHMKVSIE